MRTSSAGFLLVLWLAVGACGQDRRREVVLVLTTSVEDTGLSDALDRYFDTQSPWHVRMIAVGSGEALAIGRRGDADLLLAHSPDAEKAFVGEGHGQRRRLVMVNDFVLVGPAADPAHAKGAAAAAALSRIAGLPAPFISRGDDSGTHVRERALLERAHVEPGWPGYAESAAGQAITLQVANERGAYALTDRGTYRKLAKHLALTPLVEGDPALLNTYHAIEVDPARHPKVNAEGAHAVSELLRGAAVQRLIGRFGADPGDPPLFCPVVEPPPSCASLVRLAR